MMELVREREENKKKRTLSIIVGSICIVAVLSLVLLASFLDLPTAARIALIVFAVLVAVAGIGAAAVLDREAGAFECGVCGEKFTPDMKAYVAGAHTMTARYLKCPKCGNAGLCKHRLS